MEKLNVLIFDIETAPLLAYVFDTRDQNIGINQIKEDTYILAWAAKWLGAPASEVIYHDQSEATNIHNDKRILKILWKLLDKADIVITQNGKNFDSPRLNARFIMHGMRPPSEYRHLDTYQIARRVAKFTSNKLEYLTQSNKTYKKLLHKKFPGMELWTECLKGNPEAWAEMKTYNIHDVLATEELYMRLRAWIPDSMPDVFWVSDVTRECRKCGSVDKMVSKGYRRTKEHKYRRYQCRKCGASARGGKLR